MAISRSARITLLLIIDLVFFFVELIVGMYPYYPFILFLCFTLGYAVGSLALVADSFHMLKYVHILHLLFSSAHHTPVMS